jgi:putative ABC transport system permease protein
MSVARRDAASAAVTPLAAVLRGALTQNRLRVVLATSAIALGVALGYAVQLINEAAVGELAGGLRMLSGDADLEVRGARDGFDQALYPLLARLPEVAVASPVVEVDAKLAGRDETLRIVGHDALRAASIQPALVGTPADRLDTLRPDRLFLSAAAARQLDAREGDVVRFQVGLDERALRVAGTLPGTGSQRFAVMDIAGAQSAFDRLGRVTRIDLRARPGVDVEAVRARIRPLLPPGVAVERPETGAAATTRLSRSYRVNLDVLALVALFTGGLLVFSTQALAVVRRRAQLALLRVLGMTRTRLLAAILAEGALVGVAGSIVGLAVGFALASLAVRTFGADLGSGYFRGVVPTLRLDPSMLGIFFLLGVATAALGSLAPALGVARAAPAAALKAGDEERAFSRLASPAPGVVALVLGVAATALPPITGLPLFGYAAIALLLAGTLLLMPRIAQAALALAPTSKLAAAQLALAQLRGAPGQASVSLAAIVASVALTVSMAIMVASFRDSLDAWLERILPADLYFRAAAGGDTAFLDPAAQAQIAALPGVRRVDFSRERQLLLDPARPRVVLQARAIDSADPARSLPLVGTWTIPRPETPPPAWVNEPAADLYAFHRGAVIELPLGGRAVRFTVAGVWRDYGRPQGAIAIARETYVALTGDRTITNGALWLAPGADRAGVAQALQRAVPGGDRLDIGTPGEIRALSLRIFDRTFAVTYALELAAIVIGLAGLSSSFGALVLARRREFGVLRHLGMTRRQIAAMLATEALAVTGVGLAVGLVLGAVISLVLIHVVNRQSFHWGMELSLPWRSLATFALVLLSLSVLTVLASARRAAGVDVVRAVKDDW